MLLKAGLLTWLCAATAALNFTSPEENAHPEELLDLFEGDIVLTAEQRVLLKQRKALTSLASRWPRTIYYRFGDSSVSKTGVLAGIKHWEENTCLRFWETPSTTVDHLSFIYSSGCWSYLGRIGGGQKIGLASGCTDSMGIVAHEIGHAMGFYHEQSRTDRDNYVNILWDNIYAGYSHNFDKADSDNNFGCPYDYSSVMHYGAQGFSTSWSKNTIETKDPLGQSMIGNRNGLSHMDILLANRMYGCFDDYAKTCNIQSNHCGSYGLLRPDCSCVCPPGTTGTRCEVEEETYLNAMSNKMNGGYITITKSSGNLRNPSFPRAGTYEVYKRILQAPDCHEIRLNFNTFALDSTNCVGFYLYLTVDGKTTKYCGRNSPGYITSIGNKVTLLYGSVGSSNTQVMGFYALYEFVKKTTCSTGTTAVSTTVSTDPTTVSTDTTTVPTETTTVTTETTTVPTETTTVTTDTTATSTDTTTVTTDTTDTSTDTTTLTNTTFIPETFEVINSGDVPLKATANCSYELVSTGASWYRLKVSNWQPDCKIKLYTDEPRALNIRVRATPSWMTTWAKSILGTTRSLYKTRSKKYNFHIQSSAVELSQTSTYSSGYFYQFYYKYQYAYLDLKIQVQNQNCDKLVKMSASGHGSVAIVASKEKYEHCQLWAVAPAGTQISMRFDTGSSADTQCSRAYMFVDTSTAGFPPSFDSMDVVCRHDMPDTRLSRGNAAALHYYHYKGALAGAAIHFAAQPAL